MTRDEFVKELMLEFAKRGCWTDQIISEVKKIVEAIEEIVNNVHFNHKDWKEDMTKKLFENAADKTVEHIKNIKNDTPKYRAVWIDNRKNKVLEDEVDSHIDDNSEKEEPYTEDELREIEDAADDKKKNLKEYKPELNELGYRKDYDDITEDDIPGDYNEFCEKTKSARTFEMNPVEYLRWKKFQEEHRNCQRRPDGLPRFGAIGGGMSITFAPTGLGDLVSVRCGHCDTKVDITDTTHW